MPHSIRSVHLHKYRGKRAHRFFVPSFLHHPILFLFLPSCLPNAYSPHASPVLKTGRFRMFKDNKRPSAECAWLAQATIHHAMMLHRTRPKRAVPLPFYECVPGERAPSHGLWIWWPYFAYASITSTRALCGSQRSAEGEVHGSMYWVFSYEFEVRWRGKSLCIKSNRCQSISVQLTESNLILKIQCYIRPVPTKVQIESDPFSVIVSFSTARAALLAKPYSVYSTLRSSSTQQKKWFYSESRIGSPGVRSSRCSSFFETQSLFVRFVIQSFLHLCSGHSRLNK